MKVLIAGIGGASLGTEILKCLNLANRYELYGCDISSLAYGHYQDGLVETFVVSRDQYIENILSICSENDIAHIIPGAEEPMVLLAENADQFYNRNITIVGNATSLINLFSNKEETFSFLKQKGFNIPKTKVVGNDDDLDDFKYPCIVKPAKDTGGSSFVYWAKDRDDVIFYTSHLRKNAKIPLVQEYIGVDEGEFTVGVLSFPNGEIWSSIALRRIFQNKLSVLAKGDNYLISSGYTQGIIDDFNVVKIVCERIARYSESRGPLNIQGRVKNGVFVPFEINPRFSASTYLRAMAGFNEVDALLQFLMNGREPEKPVIRNGYYIRSFSEIFVDKSRVKN